MPCNGLQAGARPGLETAARLNRRSTMSTDKKVMIVTGASRGIGAAVAMLAARRGYSVCVNYRHRRDAADEVVAAIRAEGGQAIAVAADMADEAQVVQLDRKSTRLNSSHVKISYAVFC